MEGFPTLTGSWPSPWPCTGSTAYCRASLIDLYLCANFIETEETSCGHTNILINRHMRPTLLGLLRRVDLKCEKTLWMLWLIDSLTMIPVGLDNWTVNQLLLHLHRLWQPPLAFLRFIIVHLQHCVSCHSLNQWTFAGATTAIKPSAP